MPPPLPCVLALFLLAMPAHAQIRELPPGIQLRPVDQPVTLRDYGTEYSLQCLRIYANETTATLFYVAAGAGVELADDLHTTASGMEVLCAFDFAYYKPDPGVVDARVTLYDNTATDGAPGDVLAGPFLVTGLPTGANAFHIEVPDGFVDADVWMGVSFSDSQTGLLTYDPPDVGVSHDVAWASPPGQPGNFSGVPPASFFMGVYSSAATPARTRTWGGLKLIYR